MLSHDGACGQRRRLHCWCQSRLSTVHDRVLPCGCFADMEQFTARHYTVTIAANVQASPQDNSLRLKLPWSFACTWQFYFAVTCVFSILRLALHQQTLPLKLSSQSKHIFVQCPCSLLTLCHHNQFVYDGGISVCLTKVPKQPYITKITANVMYIRWHKYLVLFINAWFSDCE